MKRTSTLLAAAAALAASAAADAAGPLKTTVSAALPTHAVGTQALPAMPRFSAPNLGGLPGLSAASGPPVNGGGSGLNVGGALAAEFRYDKSVVQETIAIGPLGLSGISTLGGDILTIPKLGDGGFAAYVVTIGFDGGTIITGAGNSGPVGPHRFPIGDAVVTPIEILFNSQPAT